MEALALCDEGLQEDGDNPFYDFVSNTRHQNPEFFGVLKLWRPKLMAALLMSKNTEYFDETLEGAIKIVGSVVPLFPFAELGGPTGGDMYDALLREGKTKASKWATNVLKSLYERVEDPNTPYLLRKRFSFILLADRNYNNDPLLYSFLLADKDVNYRQWLKESYGVINEAVYAIGALMAENVREVVRALNNQRVALKELIDASIDLPIKQRERLCIGYWKID